MKNKEVLKALRKREKTAYPSYMRQLKAVKTWEDLEDYCESSQVEVHLLGDKGYLILTEGEVVDWVGDGRHSLKALGIIKRAFGTHPFKVDLRATTSWPIIKALERGGRLTLSNLSHWEWGGETMFAATITIR